MTDLGVALEQLASLEHVDPSTIGGFAKWAEASNRLRDALEREARRGRARDRYFDDYGVPAVEIIEDAERSIVGVFGAPGLSVYRDADGAAELIAFFPTPGAAL